MEAIGVWRCMADRNEAENPPSRPNGRARPLIMRGAAFSGGRSAATTCGRFPPGFARMRRSYARQPGCNGSSNLVGRASGVLGVSLHDHY